MSLATPGAERTDEEAVAEAAMDARRRVKIFENDSGGWGLEKLVNDWLEANPGVEILEFFPVSISTSVAIAVAQAAKEVEITTRNDTYAAASPAVEERTKEATVSAVGIYYLER